MSKNVARTADGSAAVGSIPSMAEPPSPAALPSTAEPSSPKEYRAGKRNYAKNDRIFLEACLASGTHFTTVCQRRVLCSLLKLTSREREQSKIKKDLYENTDLSCYLLTQAKDSFLGAPSAFQSVLF